MIKRQPLILLFMIAALMSTCKQKKVSFASQVDVGWEQQLLEKIKYLGHRNWIVVADAAYPMQSNEGIQTIISDKNHIETLQYVAQLISKQSHIRPIVYLDQEIDYLDEENVAGINQYKKALSQVVGNNYNKLMHEEIISMLDDTSSLFNVIVIKTDFTIPYTTVFFQLDCKYWSPAAENNLRNKISQ